SSSHAVSAWFIAHLENENGLSETRSDGGRDQMRSGETSGMFASTTGATPLDTIDDETAGAWRCARVTTTPARLVRCCVRAIGSACEVAAFSVGDMSPTPNGAENGATISVTSQSAQMRDSSRMATRILSLVQSICADDSSS